jgi:NitT/TauT family transport system substrate-binding protein
MASMTAAVQRGTVDAIFLGEPFLSAAKKNGVRVLGYAYNAIAPVFLLSSWFASNDYYRQNAALVKRFVAAVYDTARWANAHHDQSAQMLADAAKIDLATIAGSTRIRFATSLDPKQIQPMLTAMAKYDAIPQPIAAADLIAT